MEDLLAKFGLGRESHSCSGFVRLTDGGHELFTAHTTFNDYQFMLRVFRHVSWSAPVVCAEVEEWRPPLWTTLSYSARPGDMESKDDFYTVVGENGAKLAVIETSLSVFDKSIYEFVTNNTIPAWTRVLLANRLSGSASDWTALFALANSGTHNAEWIAVDYAQFLRSTALLPDTVRMLEQMPGLVVAEDVTFSLLQAQGYVPSYNIPYFPQVFNYSGFNTTGFNYTTYPRAEIFRRDQGQVQSEANTQTLMTQNNYTTDPLSQGDPCNAIAARCDLPSVGASAGSVADPYAFGAIDCKVVSAQAFAHIPPASRGPVIQALSSPTYFTQPPFAFSPNWTSVPHAGMPTGPWTFPWVEQVANRIL
jgi:hypothetical protein